VPNHPPPCLPGLSLQAACFPADSIINPEAPLALRLSGQLLLGLVRLYLRKLQFLEEDAGLTLRGLVRVRAASTTGTCVSA
jgi:cohesin complex subunit SCC1